VLLWRRRRRAFGEKLRARSKPAAVAATTTRASARHG